MRRNRTTYNLADVEPYINWLYFYHAWGLSGKPEAEKQRIKAEALDLLHQWYGRYHTHAVTVLYDANADGDDLLLFPHTDSTEETVRIPMLRQQHAVDNGEPRTAQGACRHIAVVAPGADAQAARGGSQRQQLLLLCQEG